MVDPADREPAVQVVPGACFVAIRDVPRSTRNAIWDSAADSDLNTSGRVRPSRSRITTTTWRLPFWFFAGGDLRLMLFMVRRQCSAVTAIDLDRAIVATQAHALQFRRHRLAQFVRQDEEPFCIARSDPSSSASAAFTFDPAIEKIAMAAR